MYYGNSKNPNSTGNGLLSNKQKYEDSEYIVEIDEEKPKQYNYYNLDEQSNRASSSKQNQVRGGAPPAKGGPTPKGVIDYPNTSPDYPSFDQPAAQGRPVQKPQQQPAHQNRPQNYYPASYPFPQNGAYGVGYGPGYSYIGVPGGPQIFMPNPTPMYNPLPQVYLPGIPPVGWMPPMPTIPPMVGGSQVIQMSSNGYQTVMTVNGVRVDPQNPYSFKSQILRACTHCNTQQNVPCTSTVFVCFSCKNQSKCISTHAVFKCTSCQTRVWYKYGTSRLIKCTQCQKVNRVPYTFEEAQSNSAQGAHQEGNDEAIDGMTEVDYNEKESPLLTEEPMRRGTRNRVDNEDISEKDTNHLYNRRH